MLTNKDIRVENGNIVINGDKYPLDGQSPETIMEIVEDNSDTAPTENSDAPITSGGVFTSIKSITDIDAYTVSDITDVNQSITINEFSLRKCGKIVTLGLNFNATDAIAQFANLFKLPTGIKSFGRIDAVGIFATSAPNIARLTVDDNGYVVANSAITAASYYLGSIVFIFDED